MCLILNGDHHLHSKLLCQLCGQAGGIRNRQRWCHGVRGKHFHFDHDLLTGLVRGLCDSLGCQHKTWDVERFVEKRVVPQYGLQKMSDATNHPLPNTFGQSNNL